MELEPVWYFFFFFLILKLIVVVFRDLNVAFWLTLSHDGLSNFFSPNGDFYICGGRGHGNSNKTIKQAGGVMSRRFNELNTARNFYQLVDLLTFESRRQPMHDHKLRLDNITTTKGQRWPSTQKLGHSSRLF